MEAMIGKWRTISWWLDKNICEGNVADAAQTTALEGRWVGSYGSRSLDEPQPWRGSTKVKQSEKRVPRFEAQRGPTAGRCNSGAPGHWQCATHFWGELGWTSRSLMWISWRATAGWTTWTEVTKILQIMSELFRQVQEEASSSRGWCCACKR